MASVGWPKLTEQLPPEAWGGCQRCGKEVKPFPEIWREHDQRDQPQARAVLLCKKCGKLVIAAHPRLYSLETRDAPIPGVMQMCEHCVHRNGSDCWHPDLTYNGGVGLVVTFPEPMRAIVSRGRSAGGCTSMTVWKGPPIRCEGHTPLPVPED